MRREDGSAAWRQRSQESRHEARRCSHLAKSRGRWDRYESGKFSRTPAIADWKVYQENRYLGVLVEPLGFDSLFAVEHHMIPYQVPSL